MASKDLMNNIDVKRGLSPVAAGTDNTPYVSEIVDTAGYESVTFVLQIGANTDADATFTVLFEDGDAANLSDHAAVDDAFLIGTEALASFTFADDNECRKIGYKGNKRYCRVTVTPADNGAGNIYMAAVWLLGHMRHAPAANPPA
jgi:hypothetical protein